MKVSSGVLYQCVLDDISDFLVGSPEQTAKQFAAVALKESLLKKYLRNDSTSPQADQSALSLFLKVNEELPSSVMEAETLMDQHLIGELKSALDQFWFRSGTEPLVTGLHDLFSAGRVGPGSSLGARFGDFYTKFFASRITTTSSLLYKSYRQSIESLPIWCDAENYRSSQLGEFDVCSHSNLLFVPKRNDISRTICVEPSLNMFYQLGFAKILEQRLRQVYSLDLSTQPNYNREMARIGSISGGFSTIDLSSASDSLSIGVLREILPRGFFSWLSSLRTPFTRLPDGRSVELRMISTMGNGFTFPLETIIFASVVAASYRVAGVPLIRNSDGSHGNFAVFGDDIIVETRVSRIVLRLLKLLGFQVNAAKTFVEGPFRESCGHDWFNGQFVRGVYIKSLSTPQDRYVAINLLNDWSACTGIHLSSAVQYLLSTVKRILTCPLFSMEAGIHVPASLAKPRRDRNGSFKSHYYSPRARRVEISGTRFLGSAWKKQLFNPCGLYVSFLAGYVRSQRISLRQRDVRYAMKHCIVPVWDSMQVTRSNRRFSFARWETAVYLNISK